MGNRLSQRFRHTGVEGGVGILPGQSLPSFQGHAFEAVVAAFAEDLFAESIDKDVMVTAVGGNEFLYQS